MILHPFTIQQRVTASPGGHLTYRCVPVVPSKKKDKAKVVKLPSRVLFLYRSFINAFRFAWLPRFLGFWESLVDYVILLRSECSDREAVGALVYSAEFHPFSSLIKSYLVDSSKLGKTGYGAIRKNLSDLSRSARRSIQDVACSIEQKFGKENCLFLTATHPGSTYEAIRAFAEWSGYLMDKLQKGMRKRFFKHSELYHVGIWEYQNRGALHYHGCVYLPGAASRVREFKAWFKRYWISLLTEVSLKSGVDLFARKIGGSWSSKKSVTRVDVQVVEKSVSNYLAKYLGKGNGHVKGFASVAGFPPSRWWSSTRVAKSLVREYTSHYYLPPVSVDELPVTASFVQEFLESSATLYGKTVAQSRFNEGQFLGYVGFYSATEVYGIAECLYNLLQATYQENASQINQVSRAAHSQSWRDMRKQLESENFEAAVLASEVATSRSVVRKFFSSVADWQAYLEDGFDSSSIVPDTRKTF